MFNVKFVDSMVNSILKQSNLWIVWLILFLNSQICGKQGQVSKVFLHIFFTVGYAEVTLKFLRFHCDYKWSKRGEKK
jgi:hypothetical protein